MKKVAAAVAALSLIVPSMASASTAASKSLSIKSAPVAAVRASAKPGASKAIGSELLIAIVGIVAVTVAVVVGTNGDDSR